MALTADCGRWRTRCCFHLSLEQFNSPKIERGDREGRRWGGKRERKKRNVGDEDGVCACVFVWERKGKTGRDSDKLTWGKWDVTSREKEMLNQCCQVFYQSETDVGDCRQYYWRWAASLMTARRPCFQQRWLQNQWAYLCRLREYFSLHISWFLLHTLL